MNKQIISSVMLEVGEIEAKVGNYNGGATWLLIRPAGELQGFALHATPQQLLVIHASLDKWKKDLDISSETMFEVSKRPRNPVSYYTVS